MRFSRRRVVLCLATVMALAGAVVAAAALRSGSPSADIPPFVPDVDSTQYLQAREGYVDSLRGVQPGSTVDPSWRLTAVQRLESQRARTPLLAPVWSQIGPSSVPNGQELGGADTKISGRATAIAVDPTDSNTIYLGTAQGGVWRSTDGGSTWTSIFDAASSLAIGAIALAPSSPTTLYVGTGEGNFGCDNFFGVGLYRIDNAKTSATLVGPLNKNAGAANVLSGRAITSVIVDPTNAANVFVGTKRGFSGMSCNVGGSAPTLGVYRSTNATSPAASVTFSRLTVQTAAASRDVNALAFVNNDPNTMLVSVFGNATATDGGLWRTTNALAPTPTFTNTLPMLTDNTSYAVSGNTVVVANDEGQTTGQVRESTDGGATWSAVMPAATGFCDGQCWYDLPVAIDPRTSGSTLRIYLGGNAGTAQPGASGMKVSNDNGASFTVAQNGLHADAHALFMDGNTNPTTVYFANDGGIWKRAADAAAATTWTNLNNNLPTLQFQSLAVGKSDGFFTIGGTQDNGTEMQQTSLGNWSQADFGDGGYALIDQSTTSTSTVTMYHTYFNQTNNLIGFGRVTTTASATKGGWSFLGCNTASNNGITCTDSVEFYAPMALGPGTPNTLYFGTDRLYRSNNSGSTMTLVSQAPITASTPITTIAVSPQNDNVRLVGLENGQLFATTTGSSTLNNVTPAGLPANLGGGTKWIGRVAIDPNNSNTAYLTLGYYGGANQGVWKTTNLAGGAGTWAAAGNGLPSVPVSAFAVDPNNSNNLYAGTDIGVYYSSDGGANWSPYGTGLPVVAVFDMAIAQPGTANERLRIATHGRSMWQINIASNPTAVSVASFAAQRTKAGVAITWRTGTEAAIAGFNVYRGSERLNAHLIRAKHAGQARGAVYRFLDRHGARGAHYRLQIVAMNGKRYWRS
jgi:hypothetical protein